MKLIYLMGPTGAGKSTLINALRDAYPKAVEAVEVGKLLRAKYGEDYFKGQAAPEHTQAEAWQIFKDGVQACDDAGNVLCLIDGQPRDVQQALDSMTFRDDLPRAYVIVTADETVRKQRLLDTRSDSEENLNLALQRLQNDYRNNFLVMIELARAGRMINTVDTTGMDGINVRQMFEYLLECM